MAAAPRNLVSLETVSKEYGASPVLVDVSLGVAEGDRIGVVGKNGDGKSTLLRLIALAHLFKVGFSPSGESTPGISL